MVFIYVLQCEEDKYYVGKTDTNKFRIDTHFDSNGSEFTKKYKPTDIYQIIPECDKYDEDKYVKKYMDKYGIDNVRGGTYSRIELTTEEKKYLQKELWGANDLCFLCGEEHFAKDCPNKINKTEVVGKNIETDLYIIDEEQLKIIKDRITNIEFPTVGSTLVGNSELKLVCTYNRQIMNRIHICEYFSFDNCTISEYVNNDKEIMDLYKKYVSICINSFEKITPKMLNTTCGIFNRKEHFKTLGIISNIENKIKKLITKLCYIEIDKIINILYNKNYILTNFKLNIDFKNIILNKKNMNHNTIYFYFWEDYCEMSYNCCLTHVLLFSKKDNFSNFENIADIHITGELVYSTESN